MAKAITTATGHENKNHQRNLGRTGEKGTDHCQYFYQMDVRYAVIIIKPMAQTYGRENVQSVRVEEYRIINISQGIF